MGTRKTARPVKRYTGDEVKALIVPLLVQYRAETRNEMAVQLAAQREWLRRELESAGTALESRVQELEQHDRVQQEIRASVHRQNQALAAWQRARRAVEVAQHETKELIARHTKQPDDYRLTSTTPSTSTTAGGGIGPTTIQASYGPVVIPAMEED